MSKLPFIILGVSLIVWGIRILVDPVYFSSQFGEVFNFTEIRIPFGLVLITIGGFFVWSSIKKK